MGGSGPGGSGWGGGVACSQEGPRSSGRRGWGFARGRWSPSWGCWTHFSDPLTEAKGNWLAGGQHGPVGLAQEPRVCPWPGASQDLGLCRPTRSQSWALRGRGLASPERPGAISVASVLGLSPGNACGFLRAGEAPWGQERNGRGLPPWVLFCAPRV